MNVHRDVINTIKPKQNKAKQSKAESKAESKAKQRQPYSYSYSSYHWLKSNQVKSNQIISNQIEDMLLDSDDNLLYDSDSDGFDSIWLDFIWQKGSIPIHHGASRGHVEIVKVLSEYVSNG